MLRRIEYVLLTLGVFLLPFSVHQIHAQSRDQIEKAMLGQSIGSGARALGMGGAFIAVADDATAASWNPAGLAILDRPEASLVLAPVRRTKIDRSPYTYMYDEFSTGYFFLENAGAWEVTQSSSSVDFASLTYHFRLGSVKLVPQISYQRVTDLGFDFVDEYTSETSSGPESWTAEYTNSGGIDVITLSLGVGLSAKTFLGLSLNRWSNGHEGSRSAAWTTYAGDSDRSGRWNESMSGTSFNIGSLFKPTPKLNVGLVFKSGFTMDYRREDEYASSNYATNVRDGEIKWPRSIGLGLAFMPNDTLTLSTDYTTSNWADATIDYTRTYGSTGQTSELTRFYPTFNDPDAAEETGQPRQVNSSQMRFGVEHVVRDPKLLGLTVLPVRFGVFFDRQLSKDDQTLDPVTNTGLTAGFGLVWSRLSVDVAYVQMRGQAHVGDYVVNTSEYFVKGETERPDKMRSHLLLTSVIVRF
jgi:long-subunit fatty acid transport protein